eukprot:12343530-Alexandrium_andersonii.AAC.1
MPAAEFCKNCEMVRRTGDGVEIYRCLGHELEEPLRAPGPASEDFERELSRSEPFRGLELLEAFSGV